MLFAALMVLGLRCEFRSLRHVGAHVKFSLELHHGVQLVGGAGRMTEPLEVVRQGVRDGGPDPSFLTTSLFL